MDKVPFPDLKISPSMFLDDIQLRQLCPLCNKSRKYYCYSCFIPLPSTRNIFPKVKLPFKVDIVKYDLEVDGKSTSGHAAVLAPEDVTVHIYPRIPDYRVAAEQEVLLVFPSADAITFEEYFAHLNKRREYYRTSRTAANSETECHQTSSSDNKPNRFNSNADSINRDPQIGVKLVFIDCTWFQVNKIIPDERLKGIQRLKLTERETKFWRPQRNKPLTFLSTIEAVYYAAREFHEHCLKRPYENEYDDLLFLFCYMYEKIRQRYDNEGRQMAAYDSRKTKSSQCVGNEQS